MNSILLGKAVLRNYEEYTIAFTKAYPNTLDNHMWLNPKIQDSSRKKEVGLFLDEEADRCDYWLCRPL
jgi:hypothetical protein